MENQLPMRVVDWLVGGWVGDLVGDVVGDLAVSMLEGWLWDEEMEEDGRRREEKRSPYIRTEDLGRENLPLLNCMRRMADSILV